MQWSGTGRRHAGRPHAAVRAIGKDGYTQTGAIADVVPDGATGWHTVDFSVRDE